MINVPCISKSTNYLEKTRLSHKTGITITRLKVLGVLHEFWGAQKKKLSKLKNPRS